MKFAYFIVQYWKKVYFRVWVFLHSKEGNVHLSSKNASKVRIPFTDNLVYLRPTISDTARVNEYLAKIYQNESYLHKYLKESSPTVLIDIGANIGLSSLSLLEEFSTLKKIIAIEAEVENYRLLESNFLIWKEKYPHIEFVPTFAVATHDISTKMIKTDSLASLTNANSASGTFRFDTSSGPDDNGEIQPSVSISELFKDIDISENIIVKIDIEGGEEYLLSANTEWVNRCSFLTMELHDRFHPVMIHSSKNMLRVLNDGDFALASAQDVLYCYSRSKLFK